MSETTDRWTWEYHPDRRDRRIALVAGDRDVILATGDGQRSWLEISDEDARLIAASPGLLAACRLALSVGEALHRSEGGNQRIYLGKSTVDALRRAVNEATGEPAP